MEKKYYFLKTVIETDKKIRVRALSGQKFVDGSAVNPAINISSDKKIRSQFPIGTIYCCEELASKGKFYIVKSFSIYPVSVPGADVPRDTPRDMVEAYIEFTGGTGVAPETPEKKEPKKKGIPSLMDRLSARKDIKPPTIDENGFYVDKDIWYLLVRNINKNINTLILGPTGCGKTEIIGFLGQKLGTRVSYYDMGAMHDPMTGLLGSHRIKDGHSVFDPAKFTKDIQEEGIIVLDELSRAPLSTNNILFPCLDSRRELPVEIADSESSRSIPVDEEVCFFATANVGGEYTGTNIIDRALIDRFFPVELSYLEQTIESEVLQKRTMVDKRNADTICEIAKTIRNMYAKGEISVAVSPRHTLDAASLVKDGFTLLKAMSFVFLPLFEGSDSFGERNMVKTLFSSR